MIHVIMVTDENIKNGNRCDSNKCPVALALRNHFNINWIGVTYDIRINRNYFTTPDKVLEFIKNFDNRFTDISSLKPFEFELEIPDNDQTTL